jgi:spore maturation protein CgeB
MPTAVNQRVWDVPGTGGFLLTDAQDDVRRFFVDGTDIALYETFEEAVEKASWYLQRPDEALKIAARGHAKIEAAHRVTHRLLEMYQVMKARFS